MTKQEMFDKAYLGLNAQGCGSYSDKGCLYNDGKGNKCAIGHLIDDSTALEWDKGSNISIRSILTNSNSGKSIPEYIDVTLVDFMEAMQSRLHDGCYTTWNDPVYGFEVGSLMFATAYGLTIPEIPVTTVPQ
jgi:hypothetical protein